jgi:hypothetical protein
MEATKKSRIWVIFVAISMLLGSIIFGTYKRTLSSSLGEIEHKSFAARSFCNILEYVLNDPDHCINEYKDYLEEQK